MRIKRTPEDGLAELGWQQGEIYYKHGADQRTWPPEAKKHFGEIQVLKSKYIREIKKREQRKQKRLEAGGTWQE